MSKYQSIVGKLLKINGTIFQELCENLLILDLNRYTGFSRTGSHTTKQKTTRGTPDSYFSLPNGKFIFVEKTTNTSDVNKLKNDIHSCFDINKSKIKAEDISHLILCFNWNIDQAKSKELFKLAKSYNQNIIIQFYSLDLIAMLLNAKYKDLVRDYLDLAIDTGQVVSIETFIKEYDQRALQGISAPLSNKFYHREDEKIEILESLINSEYTIVAGSPGVGKTKLVLETMKEFLGKNPTYNAFCISYKSCDLIEDLNLHLNPDNNYILFIDDANRNDRLRQIIGFKDSVRKGGFKIIVTVRDYALHEVRKAFIEKDPNIIAITKLDDPLLIDIIESEPFEILNRAYQEAILSVAEGNVRIAIMAAIYAKQTQDLSALNNLSSLFDKYYASLVTDTEEFESEINLKCLGIISFFRNIEYLNRETLEPILKSFDIDFYTFNDVTQALDKLELVHLNYGYIKIIEQNLSAYFFYRCFIKEKLLPFSTLLDKYFTNHESNFREVIIPANNIFGHQNVMESILPDLRNYYKINQIDQDRSIQLFGLFAYYMQVECMAFIYEYIHNLPIPLSVDHTVEYGQNDFSYTQDQILNLLSLLMQNPIKKLSDVVSLALEYCKKKPGITPELSYTLHNNFQFKGADFRYRFYRQKILFDVLINGLNKGDRLETLLFYSLAKSFMRFQFQYFESGRKMTIVSSKINLPNSQNIRTFRENIWNAVINNYSVHKDLSFSFLQAYGIGLLDTVEELLLFDLPYVLILINSHLSKDDFLHCRWIHQQLHWYARKSIKHPSFIPIKEHYTNKLFEEYLILDNNQLRDKQDYEFDNMNEYSTLKEDQIRSSFKFNNRQDVKEFYITFYRLKALAGNDWFYNQAFEYVFDENTKHDFSFGFHFLSEIIHNNNEIDFIPFKYFKANLTNKDQADQIWEVINKNDYKQKSSWLLLFFIYLSEEILTSEHPDQILEVVRFTEVITSFNFNGLFKYLKFRKSLFQEILSVIVDNNAKKSKVWVQANLFDDHFTHFEDNLELVKITYIQQYNLNSHFDYSNVGFLNILRKDISFLYEFFLYLKKDKEMKFHRAHNSMSFIWEIDNIEVQILKIIELLTENEMWFGIAEHNSNVFFTRLSKSHKERADNFILHLIDLYHADTKKMNMILDIIRNSRRGLFEKAILKYLSLNQDKEYFRKIQWRSSNGAYFGDVNIADEEAKNWISILEIVEKSELGIKLLPIKKVISDRIQNCLEDVRWEKKMKFLRQF